MNDNQPDAAPAIGNLGPLAAATMTSLRAFFDARNHHPSADHWLALQDIATTLEDMANGTV